MLNKADYHFRFYKILKNMGARYTLNQKLENLHVKFYRTISYSFQYIRTYGHGWIDSVSDPDQEYIYFMGNILYYGISKYSLPYESRGL